MKNVSMKMVGRWGCFALALTLAACKGGDKGEDSQVVTLENLTQYVDPFIGTGDHGHVFMGANVPFGLVQVGPTNYSQGWDWCSGYHITDSTIIGFGQMHLSGTGIGDLGDISLMPAVGDVKLTRGELGDPASGIYSLFSHSTEKSKPGYYAVHLDRFNIDVELTATKRVGFSKFTFPKSTDAKVIFDLEHGIGWDSPRDGMIVQENDSTLSGYRFSKGWADNQRIYFTAVFSKPMKNFVLDRKQIAIPRKQNGANAPKTKADSIAITYGQAFFDTEDKESIYVKVALSPVSVKNAKLNMQTELPGWNFEQTIDDANAAWNKELNKIVIDADDRTKRIFYTALYHTMIAPSEFCDVNKDYMGSDSVAHTQATFTNYTTFSLWDTYRAAHPLMTIIHPEKMSDVINTMLNIYKEQGKLPVWHLMGNETNCMVGNPGICVVGDAVLKGIGGFDKNLAYEAMKNSAMLTDRAQGLMHQYGYIPFDLDKDHESVAKTMEYAIADWCVAQVAQQMGNQAEVDTFTKLSKSYVNYFDPETHFMRGKDSKGKFRTPFDPFHSVHRENDYTEGTAWQYTFLVPQDVDGLVALFGGKEAFEKKLDSLFVVSGDMGEDASPDISGLIGQYAHGNEPGHHEIYLYSCIGKPAKTAEKVRYVLDSLYTDQPAGLCGNEDVGAMSAWYVLSSMGIYQVAPAGGIYYFGSPAVNKATIQVGDGKTFTIVAKNNSPTNIYIQSIALNGAPYDKDYIDFPTITAGGTLEFTMGAQPK